MHTESLNITESTLLCTGQEGERGEEEVERMRERKRYIGGGGGRWKGVRERDVDRRHGGEDGSRLVRSAPAGSRPSRHAAESLKRRPRVFLGLLIYCYYLFF